MRTIIIVGILLALLAGCAKHIPVPPTPTPTNSGRSVVLTWTASTTPGVSYNAYRFAGTCASSTTGTKLNTTPITALTYTDPDVPVGTLCYWTTAFLTASATQESVPSNKAEVTIITQPNPPTNLQISPTAVTMQTGTTQLFRANALDVIWSISPAGMGTISTGGLYTAPQSIQGNNVRVDVIAQSGDQQAVAQVTLRKN